MPDYTSKSNEAEWHITYRCDLACPNCNRLCFLPPTTADMTLDDAREFNRQARELGWFPKIVILGGEPTLHRDLFELIEIANELSPGRVEVWSNGYRQAAKDQLARIRAEGRAKVCEETIKTNGCTVLPQADFFLAPKDFGVINHRPCHNHAAIGCGISVDAEGYAACSIGGAIDSVLQLGDHQWSVVLLDHEPPPRRGVDALRLKDRSQLIIGHDSEHPDYGYGPAFDQFKYRFTLSRVFPWTTVVSDTDPLDWIEDALRPLW
jgi:hypothetical protein